MWSPLNVLITQINTCKALCCIVEYVAKLDIEYMHLSDLKECHSIEACKTQEIETRCPASFSGRNI